jgi:NAD-dependent protein deacetylase/lipoamidase
MSCKPTREDWQRALDGPVLVITGAGLSADSGLQTFRGSGGLWRNYNPMTLATPEAFARDPRLVWEWYQWRRGEAAKATPNPAHLALAQVASNKPDCLIVTQNVDNLHERARTPEDQLVHVHGDLFLNRCTKCSYSDREAISCAELPPGCPRCQKAALRPGVVWFGESLDSSMIRRVENFVCRGKCGLVLVVGTTATFHYIIDWALRAKRSGGLLVEVNPEETELSESADIAYRERAADVLPELLGF